MTNNNSRWSDLCLRVETGQETAQLLRLIVLNNHIDYPAHEAVIARGSLTLGSLDDMSPQDYQALRAALQSFCNSANLGGLLMVREFAMFAGLTVTPTRHLPETERVNLGADIRLLLKVQYIATRPYTNKNYILKSGIWREDKSDEQD